MRPSHKLNQARHMSTWSCITIEQLIIKYPPNYCQINALIVRDWEWLCCSSAFRQCILIVLAYRLLQLHNPEFKAYTIQESVNILLIDISVWANWCWLQVKFMLVTWITMDNAGWSSAIQSVRTNLFII